MSQSMIGSGVRVFNNEFHEVFEFHGVIAEFVNDNSEPHYLVLSYAKLFKIHASRILVDISLVHFNINNGIDYAKEFSKWDDNVRSEHDPDYKKETLRVV